MVGEIVRIMLNRDKDMTNDLGKLDWVLNLRDYVNAASIPSNAEEIYSIALNYLNSDGYKKTWNLNNQHPMSDEEWSNWGGIVVKYLLDHGFSENNFKISISHTTRKPRSNEIDGVDYHFVSKDKFELLEKELLF